MVQILFEIVCGTLVPVEWRVLCTLEHKMSSKSFYEIDMLERLFKLCPRKSLGAISLNHIPDMPLWPSVSSSLKSCPMHSCVIG